MTKTQQLSRICIASVSWDGSRSDAVPKNADRHALRAKSAQGSSFVSSPSKRRSSRIGRSERRPNDCGGYCSSSPRRRCVRSIGNTPSRREPRSNPARRSNRAVRLAGKLDAGQSMLSDLAVLGPVPRSSNSEIRFCVPCRVYCLQSVCFQYKPNHAYCVVVCESVAF